MAKGIRPDVRLRVGDRELTLRASMEALEAIERRLDAGLPRLFRRLRDQDARFTDLAVIVEEGVRAFVGRMGKDGVSYAEAFELAQLYPKDLALAALEFVAGAFGPPPEADPPPPPPAT